MAVYCPDCGNVLKTGVPAKEHGECARCERPLGDPNHVEREDAVEKYFRVLFLNSVPLAIAAVLAGIILLTLAACLLFPVQTQHALSTLGIASDGAGYLFGIPLHGFEWLMIGAGAMAILLFLRLPARQRAAGRL